MPWRICLVCVVGVVLSAGMACDSTPSGAVAGTAASARLGDRKHAASRGDGDVAPSSGASSGNRYALLVGVTAYPSLSPSRQLKGPANDVALFRALLIQKLGFTDAGIRTLAEGNDPEHLPTRANILKELQSLAERGRPGDRIVVHLSGHGAVQPLTTADGSSTAASAIFLPRDVGRWDSSTRTVTNAIVDREFSAWANQALQTGAAVWMIVDACHSGGLAGASTRGDGETPRQIAPGELEIPENLVASMRASLAQRASPARGSETPAGGFLFVTDSPAFVANYACRNSEITPELEFPAAAGHDASQRVKYGLFSHTLAEVLMRAEGELTYVELARRIKVQYVSMGRVAPVPLVAGMGKNKILLAEQVRRADIRLRRSGSDLWLNAGKLHGLNVGSILAVYPAAAKTNDRAPLGFVRICYAGGIDAKVEPIAYGSREEVNSSVLPDGAPCEVERYHYVIEPLRVQIEAAAGAHDIEQDLRRREVSQRALFQIVNDAESADLRLRFDGRTTTIEEVVNHRKLSVQGVADQSERIVAGIARIALARNLLRAGGLFPQQPHRPGMVPPQVALRMLRFNGADDQSPTPRDDSGGGITLRDGQIIAFEMSNTGTASADVTLLLVDGGYGIRQMFPRPGTSGDNRIRRGETRRTEPLKADAGATRGPEAMVMIAVAGDAREPRDFSFLAQPSLALAAGSTRGARAREDAYDTPLGRLLRYCLYHDASTRGDIAAAELTNYSMSVMGWVTEQSEK